MIKEKYKQLCLHRLFGGVSVIEIHLRYLQAEKKIHRTVKHIYFLPTLKANAQKNKRACPSPPPPTTI